MSLEIFLQVAHMRKRLSVDEMAASVRFGDNFVYGADVELTAVMTAHYRVLQVADK